MFDCRQYLISWSSDHQHKQQLPAFHVLTTAVFNVCQYFGSWINHSNIGIIIQNTCISRFIICCQFCRIDTVSCEIIKSIYHLRHICISNKLIWLAADVFRLYFTNFSAIWVNRRILLSVTDNMINICIFKNNRRWASFLRSKSYKS